jgi:hypothetical protein
MVESFQHQTILPIHGLPTYESLSTIFQLLNANDASIPHVPLVPENAAG